ncbi:hypothetical protein E2562_015385 [Oryza meyeriana var. granulata]|uniref:Uncharacterized protein n=1 Tax=Oryza meyeriana var. granulata TaxID=110450 RepID=A0A6G1EJ55_9ORYZ|nr:hypothetical protein E2562_015385 [Oryza meyeriana var. granulata]
MFHGLAEYVPEYNLWFGLSSSNNTNHLCAFDLAGAAQRLGRPQATHGLEADDTLPGAPGGRQVLRCKILRDPRLRHGYAHREFETYGLFTGVEVEPCGKAGRGLRMVKHWSECYHWNDIIL